MIEIHTKIGNLYLEEMPDKRDPLHLNLYDSLHKYIFRFSIENIKKNRGMQKRNITSKGGLNMGSVIDYKKCPQCGGVMYNDYNYRNQEEYSSCERCGKGFTYLMKRDENGQVILNDKKQPEYVLKEWDGKGVAHLMGEKCGESCHFSEPVTEEFIKQFLEEVETNTSLKKDECYLTTWDEETKTVKAIYGKIPKLFDEV